MLTYAALKRTGRRKIKAKARFSFGSTSKAPSTQPSRWNVDLPRQFTRPEVQQRGEGRLRCDDSKYRAKGSASNLCRNDEKAEKALINVRAAESSSESIEPIDGNKWASSTKKSTTDASSFNSEGNRIPWEKAQSGALVDSDSVVSSRLPRKSLNNNGPSLVEDLQNALNPLQVQRVVHASGAFAACINHGPESELSQEGRYTLVYDKRLHGGECDCRGSPRAHVDQIHGRYSSGSSDRVLKHADDDEPEHEPCSSSSSSCYESAIEEEPEESHGLRDASRKVPWSCCSRGVQAVQETSDADTQTSELNAGGMVEMPLTLQSRNVDAKQLKQWLENVLQDHVSEARQLHLMTEQLLARLQEATPQYVVRLTNCTASREQKLIDKNRADDEVGLPQPRPPLRQRNLPTSFRPENNALTRPVETKTQRLTHADKQCSSSETPLPAKEAHEQPDSPALPKLHLLNQSLDTNERSMPTYAALKRAESRKIKVKASFGSTSRALSNQSSCRKADLPCLFSRPEVQWRDRLVQSRLRIRDAEVKHLKKRLQNVRRNQASEVQQLRLKIEQLLARPQVSTPQYGVRTRNRTASRERKPVDNNRAYGEVSPPRLPLQQRILPVRRIPENNLLTPPVETKIRPMPQADKKYSRSERSVKEVHKLRGSEKSADKRTDVESVGSSQGKTENSSTDMQISRIVRMAKKHRPDVTNTEIREALRHVRLTKGGFSDMIFSAIVDLALGQLKDGPEDRVKACEGRPPKTRSTTRN
ncbi:hypothetical protein MRX96_010835 [Rhipicephalus microplus]